MKYIIWTTLLTTFVERDENFVLLFRWQSKDDIRTRWEAADERIKAKSTQQAD